MNLKLLIVLASISFCCQISFSIFYSTKIIDENTLINNLEKNLIDINIQNQQLETKLAQLNSLSNIVSQTIDKSYLPINSSIQIK